MDLFIFKKVLTVLVLPPTGPLILALAGLTILNAKPMVGRLLAWLGVLLLLALSLPLVSRALLNILEVSPPIDLVKASSAQAIVILGGGIRRHALEYGGDTLSRLTLDRTRYGALVARKTGLPVLVTGGVLYGAPAEATLMTQSLKEEFNIKVKWAEATSRNTHENAVQSAKILLPLGIRRVILVAHGFDMRRAKEEFTAAGLNVIPAPTYVVNGTIHTAYEFVPSVTALQDSYYAVYELLAITVLEFKL
jgi:uncharacterized SAM-binding protein YcdF (DUF218 family)